YFFFHCTPPPEIYTLSLHDALPISQLHPGGDDGFCADDAPGPELLQSRHSLPGRTALAMAAQACLCHSPAGLAAFLLEEIGQERRSRGHGLCGAAGPLAGLAGVAQGWRARLVPSALSARRA